MKNRLGKVMNINIFSIFGNSEHHPLIPVRDPGAISGSGFIGANINLTGAAREKNILDEFMHGNMPNFLKDFKEIRVSDGNNTLVYLTTSDYLSIGHDADYIRMPMNPLSAQLIADKYDCTLPTRKMVNDIWAQSENKLIPLPWGPPYDIDMIKTHRIGTHSYRITKQLIDSNKNPFALTSGHKKDVVLTNNLYPKNPKRRVAIYGWIQLNGRPIQGLNSSSHEDTYEDYSHGIRLVMNDAILNGQPVRIQDVFTNPKLAHLVSDEGVLRFLRY